MSANEVGMAMVIGTVVSTAVVIMVGAATEVTKTHDES
jgi:purine-cytosine permease-like protein